MRRVAILVFEDVALFELGCATELFLLPRPEFSAWYQTELVTFEQGACCSVGGLQLQVSTRSDLSVFDTVVVPNWPVAGTSVAQPLATALRRFSDRGGRLLSFCSGAFLLAELGLLSGRQAVTHWRYADVFQQRFPDVEFCSNVLYTFDGQIGCSAGSAAALDLGLEVIRRDFGQACANAVARRLVISAHRQGGQVQFAERPVAVLPNHFSGSLDWAIAHLDQPISVDDLASRALMSRRSFDRRFRADLGVSPKQWLVRQRLERGKALLERSSESIEWVAQQVGFESATLFRHHFRTVLGISPTQYRQQFTCLPNTEM